MELPFTSSHVLAANVTVSSVMVTAPAANPPAALRATNVFGVLAVLALLVMVRLADRSPPPDRPIPLTLIVRLVGTFPARSVVRLVIAACAMLLMVLLAPEIVLLV